MVSQFTQYGTNSSVEHAKHKENTTRQDKNITRFRVEQDFTSPISKMSG